MQEWKNNHCKPASSLDVNQRVNHNSLFSDHPKPVWDFHHSEMKWHQAPSQELFVQFPQLLSSRSREGSLNHLLFVSNLSFSVHIFCPVSVRLSFFIAKYLALKNIMTWFWRFSLQWSSKNFCNSEAKFHLMNDTSLVSEGSIYVEQKIKQEKKQLAICKMYFIPCICIYTIRLHSKIYFTSNIVRLFTTTNKCISWEQYFYKMQVK